MKKAIIIICTFFVSSVALVACKQNTKVVEEVHAETQERGTKDSTSSVPMQVVDVEVEEKLHAKESTSDDTKPEVKAKIEKEQPKVKVPETIDQDKVKEKSKPLLSTKAMIYFPDTLFEFGFIDEGDSVTHVFKFLNTGDAPLEIHDVQVTCGCTIPKYSLEAIEPGRINQIEVLYNSAGKFGKQLARIDVFTNTDPSMTSLYLKGVVRAEVSGSD